MPLGIVSDKEFDSERINSDVSHTIERNEDTEKSTPVVTSDVLTLPSVGRDRDVPNVPQSLRKMIGEEVATNGLKSAMKFASSLGISQPTASTYARGEVSPGTTNPDLLQHINNRKTKISKKALNKLSMALNHLDDSKLLGCDAKELSSVAKDMAAVVNSMSPKEAESVNPQNAQFHFYAPQIRNEKHYETVVAKDNY